MTTWHEYLRNEGQPPAWPYPIRFGQERVIDTDVLVIGGGIAGCWAAISAARQGVKVALVEKGDVARSGSGGPGCDHWCNAPANPLSRVNPDEWAAHMADRPYCNGIGIQIQCREDFDTLLEMEQMGGKIRDTGDEYAGAEGRDDKTKFMISPRYGTIHSYLPDPHMGEPGFNPPETRNNVVIRVWGNTFKPILKKECKRLGVEVFDRVMGTSLLNENGAQGARVVGATGLNGRTGEFLIFRAKAVILSTAGGGSLWLMSMEHGGYSNMHSRAISGDGTTMAWKAGAALTKMESSNVLQIATGLKHKWYTGGGDASYENVPIVDANGRRLPYPIQGWEDAGAMLPSPEVEAKIREGILKGEYELPFYGDFPAMPEVERRATWNLMLAEEATTRIFINTMKQGGFDINRDLLQSYKFIEGQSLPQWRDAGYGGGLVVDWNLQTTVEGLYAAGTQTFSPEDHSYAAATGRYAGRKAAAYIRETGDPQIHRDQVEREKNRVFAPTKRGSGIEWKELHSGITRAMQYYVSEFKTERLLKMGLDELERLEAESVPRLFAHDPHKLMRTIEDLSMLENAKIIIHASRARKASSTPLNFKRIDFPENDPAEWQKFLTLRLENNQVRMGELPPRFWGDMARQYEAHNKDYTGVYAPK
ncbi:MAG: FAD-dependent oxidoreductase [Acidobacteriota bacterium]|jgi:succinate dehydrogenase/fumarate reductase flavoprotein subunit|nr:FAD-dependent oxidoreductase [Acidobacteriota bacterium]